MKRAKEYRQKLPSPRQNPLAKDIRPMDINGYNNLNATERSVVGHNAIMFYWSDMNSDLEPVLGSPLPSVAKPSKEVLALYKNFRHEISEKLFFLSDDEKRSLMAKNERLVQALEAEIN